MLGLYREISALILGGVDLAEEARSIPPKSRAAEISRYRPCALLITRFSCTGSQYSCVILMVAFLGGWRFHCHFSWTVKSSAKQEPSPTAENQSSFTSRTAPLLGEETALTGCVGTAVLGLSNMVWWLESCRTSLHAVKCNLTYLTSKCSCMVSGCISGEEMSCLVTRAKVCLFGVPCLRR